MLSTKHRDTVKLYVPDTLPTFWALVQPLPQEGVTFSPPVKLPGSFSAEFYAYQQRVEFLQMLHYSLAVFLHCINI